jgi:hypothetical protein
LSSSIDTLQPIHSKRHTLGVDSFSYSYHLAIDEIADLWDSLSIEENFAQSRYLQVLEDDAPDHIQSIYVIVYDKDTPIGAILLQHLILKLSSALRYKNYSKSSSSIMRWFQGIRQWIVSKFQFRLLNVGNLYLTGEYGFYFNDQALDFQEQFSIVDSIVMDLKKKLRPTAQKFSAVLYKDFFDEHLYLKHYESRMHPFQIDPNMILSLHPSWTSFEDYLGAMRSKYRIRMKNAIKKFDPVHKRVLSLDDVRRYNDDMYHLYCDILSGSGFVLIKSQQDYFKLLKEAFQDEIQVVGYFLKDELVAFYTWTIDGDRMDSHFIGVSSQYNLKYQLYLNILLDLVRDAISNRAQQLLYFRTALEIKSSVGAIPYDMTVYIRHNNRFLAMITPTIFKYFVPKQSWAQRHPFKKPSL